MQKCEKNVKIRLFGFLSMGSPKIQRGLLWSVSGFEIFFKRDSLLHQWRHFPSNRKSIRVVLFVRQGSQGSTFRGRFSRKPPESNRRLGIQNTFVDHANVGLRAPGCGWYGSRDMIFQSFSKKNFIPPFWVNLPFYGEFFLWLSRGQVQPVNGWYNQIQNVYRTRAFLGFVPPCKLDLYIFEQFWPP
jgi:hypothetical protein